MENLYLTLAELIVAGLLGFAGVIFLIPRIIQYAVRHNMVDRPNERKVHKGAIPRLGGIAFGGMVLVIFMLFIAYTQELRLLYILGALLLIFITGLVDDLKDIRAGVKFAIQLLAAWLIAANGVRVTSLWGLFGITDLSLPQQYGITIITIVAITNSFNLIDGIDGLAGGIGFINAVVLGSLALAEHLIPFAVLNFALAGGLLAFLVYNFHPAKIFMGDGGSTLIGFLMGTTAVYLATSHESLPSINVPVALVGILLLPVFDTMRIFIERIVRRISPFHPEKNHIHHLLLETGFNHKRASITLYLSNIIIIFYAMIIQNYLDITASLITIFIFGITLFEICTIRNILSNKAARLRETIQLGEIRKENALIK